VGRWDDSRRGTKPLRPASAKFYYARLHTFFAFCVEEEAIPVSPMAKLKAPIVRQDQIQPFTQEQQQSLLAAARKSRHPKRDEALILFLLDTGARVSEACALRVKDLDLTGRRCQVRGKGDKDRTICFGGVTMMAVWAYLKDEPREPDVPLLLSDRGTRAGEALTRSGVLQIFKRLGKAAKIESTRCSPHSARNTFAVSFLKAGGSLFSLQQLLGHCDLAMTRRYVALAEADVEAQHRQFSPMDRLGKRR
jgi:integrase/recombinase XerD